MENKSLSQYALMACVVLILAISLVNLFKTSGNLKEAKKGIIDARQKVDESLTMLKNQKMLIDSIKQSNLNLLEQVDKMESEYSQIRQVINTRFNRTTTFLDSLRNQIKNLPKPGPGPIE